MSEKDADRKRDRAEYAREWRRKRLEEDPGFRKYEQEIRKGWYKRKLVEDPDWQRRHHAAYRERKIAADPDWQSKQSARRAAARQARRESDPAWREKQRAKSRAQFHAIMADPDRAAERRGKMRVYTQRKRLEAIEIFGAKCVRCGFDDSRALEVDHINGDGHLDSRSGYSRWIKLLTMAKNEGIEALRKHFQVLCSNCHRIKTHENGDWTRNRRKD